jgi:hypothetical protein
VTTVRCKAVRWISYEPQPGWVEVQLTDADGAVHSCFDKPPIFEAGNQIRPDAEYPFDIDVDCWIETDDRNPTLEITMTYAETPDGRKAFRVARELIR